MNPAKCATFRRVGDALHILNLFSIAFYASSVFLHGSTSDGMFDPEWLRDGFCLPARDPPFWTTHDLSGYAMVAITLAGMALWYYVLKGSAHGNARGMQIADGLFFWASIGALGHAAGHFLISHSIRNGLYPAVGDVSPWDDIKDKTIPLVLAKLGPGYLFFWIPLVKTYMMHASSGRVAIFALAALAGALPVPIKFGFAYTQIILFAGLSVDQLISIPAHDKGFEYALWPLATVLPSTAMSWVESTGCSTNSIMVGGGGHVAYDALMSFSYVLYYLICLGVSSVKLTTGIQGEGSKTKAE